MIADRQAVAEGDAPLARHRRQQAQRFHPHAHRGEMRRQQQIAQPRARPAQQRQQRHHHGKQPDAAQADRERHFDRRRAGAERGNQDDLRRRRPHQHGRQRQPPRRKAEIMRERADADIGAGQTPERTPRSTPISRRRKRRRRWKLKSRGRGHGGGYPVSQRQLPAQPAGARMRASAKCEGRASKPGLGRFRSTRRLTVRP